MADLTENDFAYLALDQPELKDGKLVGAGFKYRFSGGRRGKFRRRRYRGGAPGAAVPWFSAKLRRSRRLRNQMLRSQHRNRLIRHITRGPAFHRARLHGIRHKFSLVRPHFRRGRR